MYGRFGRLRRRACRHDWQIYVVEVVAEEGRLGNEFGRRTGRSAIDISAASWAELDERQR